MEQVIQAETAWLYIMGICGAIITLGGAIAVLVKLYRWVRKPSAENTDSIEQMMDYLASDKRRIEALERRQDEQEAESKLMLKSLMQIMSHEIDGNHKEQLRVTRDEVEQFLIDK
ncbi:MAG: hypothetical protein IJ087_00285 [Eggerthellaceae bacterium]|nr:hypothetical protein [Eggerthellaceae bacterium]